MFVVAAVGAGFLLFVNNSMNLSQRAREEQEAFVLAQAGLAFADAQLTENGADWRPSILVDFDEFEKAQGWHRPDSDNDWYGKYAARQVVDLLGNVAGSGAFLIKVKYKPDEQVFKIISIGRPRPNSPVYRRLVAYKPLLADWIWVTAENETNPDPLLFDADNDNLREVLLGQAINWQVEQNFWFNAERDPLQPVLPPPDDPQRLRWLRLRTWLSPNRLPIWDRTSVFTSTIRINSDLLWYGTNAVQVTDFFASAQTALEVAGTIRHYPLGGGLPNIAPQTQVLVYDWQEQFQGFAQPSNAGSPPGSGFVFFPIGGVPRYMDGWERLGGLMPIRWVFNFPRRVAPRTPPNLDLPAYYAQTRDADPPFSQYGYYRLPDPLRGQAPALDNTPNSLTFGFYVLNYFDPNSPTDPNRLLAFRGIYIDNFADKQFVSNPPNDAPSTAFNDATGNYRPELAQVYDWVVKPSQTDLANPNMVHPRRRQRDSGWLQDDAINASTERNLMELTARDANNQPQPLNFAMRMTAPHLYVPPGVEVRFDVVTTNNPQVVLQRTWLIRHDGQPFRAPDGTPLSNRLVFIDPVQITPGTDPINFRDDDGNGLIDDDPPLTNLVTLQPPQRGLPSLSAPHVPEIVLLAEGNIRLSGQVAVSIKIVTPETIYIEGPLHPVTSNATIELLAKRNVCFNFAAAKTPIPPDGLNPQTERSLLLPQWRIAQLIDPQNQGRGESYALPNLPINPQADQRLPLFADLLGGSVLALRFPAPEDGNGDGLVDAADPQGRSPSITFALSPSSLLSLSDDLTQRDANGDTGLDKLVRSRWTLRLVLLHRGLAAIPDPNSPTGWQLINNPWTNLEVDLWLDSNDNGLWDANEPRIRLYGPSEPMRTFPVASRWYQGDGRPVDPNDPTTGKEWGILDIPIPTNIFDLNGDGQLTPNELQSALQKMRITVTSPVAGEVIPQGRTPVSYELAGIKLALYDENGLPRPIWQPVIAPTQQNPFGSPFFVLAQTIHAENGTIGFVPPPYFDPTAHPSWQRLIASNDPNWQARFRQWQRLWSFYYLRHNGVRWTPFLDPNDPNLTLPPTLRAQLIAQSAPIIAGQLIMRVTPQTILWRLAAQGAIPATDTFKPQKDNSLRFALEVGWDRASLPYTHDLDPQNKLADLINLQRQIAPVFAEVPPTMFSSAWLWAWRAAPPQGVMDVRQPSPLPSFYRAPVVPDLNLPKGYVMVLQQQLGKD